MIEPTSVEQKPPSSERDQRLQTWAERALEGLRDDRVCWIVLGAAILAYAALALYLTRGTTLFVDEYQLFVNDHGFRPYALFSPANGHLLLVSRLVYATGYKLFGVDFLFFRLVVVVGAALAASLLFTLLKRRVGGAAALAPTVLLLFLGSAWEITFIVSGLGNVYSIAAGLGALLALERGDRRGDLTACALLIASIAATTFGVAFAIGAGVLVLLSGNRRRLWIVLVPLALYVVWLVWVRAVYIPEHGNVQVLHLSNILLIPNYIANEAASVAGAVAGLDYNFLSPEGTQFVTNSAYGALLATAAAVALGLRLRRGGVTPFLWASIAILLALWIELALGWGLGRTPTTVRYVYPGAILVFVIAAEALRGVRPSNTALLVLFAATALALTTNFARLRDGMAYYRDFSISIRAQLTGLELARDSVDPSFIPEDGPAHFDIVKARPYLAGVDRIGSPAYSPAELVGQSETYRSDADSILVSALGIRAATRQPGDHARNCRRLPAAGEAPLRLLVNPPGVLLRSRVAAKVALRRFASTLTVPVGTLHADETGAIRIPADRSTTPWHLTVTPSSGSHTQPVTACQLRTSQPNQP